MCPHTPAPGNPQIVSPSETDGALPGNRSHSHCMPVLLLALVAIGFREMEHTEKTAYSLSLSESALCHVFRTVGVRGMDISFRIGVHKFPS